MSKYVYVVETKRMDGGHWSPQIAFYTRVEAGNEAIWLAAWAQARIVRYPREAGVVVWQSDEEGE